MNNSYKKIFFTIGSIIAIIGYSFVVFAAAPNGGYTPGATLDPDCAPGDTDCVVTVAGFSPNSILYTNADGSTTTDSLFTRDSTTKETNILRSFDVAGVSQTVLTIPTTYIVFGAVNTFQIGETIESDPAGLSATITAISTISTPPQGILSDPVFTGTGNDDLRFNNNDYTGTDSPNQYTVTITDTNLFYSGLNNVVGTFQDGETITGNTSGATAELIVYLNNNVQYVIVNNIVGAFQGGETITGNTSGATSDLYSDLTSLTDVFTMTNNGGSVIGLTATQADAGLDDVSVAFDSSTGHQIGDQWTFTATIAPITYTVLYLDNLIGAWDNGELTITGLTSGTHINHDAGIALVPPVASLGDSFQTQDFSTQSLLSSRNYYCSEWKSLYG